MGLPVAESYTLASGGIAAAGRYYVSPFYRDMAPGWTDITPAGTAPYHGILAYSGMAVDQVRGKIHIAGCGGHNDYSGEDAWEFDYENRTPWAQHYTPWIYQGIPLADARALIDNTNWPGALMEGGAPVRPISRHTYKTVHWIESIQEVSVGGGSTFGGNGDYLWYHEDTGAGAWWNAPADYWGYNPFAKVWNYKGSKLKTPAYDVQGSQHIYAREIDRVFSLVQNGNNQLKVIVWNPQTNTWSMQANRADPYFTDVVGCYDSTRNKLILLCVNNYAGTAPYVLEYDIATDTYTVLETTGTMPTGWYSGSGMVYSPKTRS
ncbi:MAG: Kelch repeat protein, partial [Proteobacteria bacterium]|nr:Kelch repeat protein [Pseudomonadota bacterium]